MQAVVAKDFLPPPIYPGAYGHGVVTSYLADQNQFIRDEAVLKQVRYGSSLSLSLSLSRARALSVARALTRSRSLSLSLSLSRVSARALCSSLALSLALSSRLPPTSLCACKCPACSYRVCWRLGLPCCVRSRGTELRALSFGLAAWRVLTRARRARDADGSHRVQEGFLTSPDMAAICLGSAGHGH
jgi:hypothetical protein